MQQKKYLITTPLFGVSKQGQNYCHLYTWLSDPIDNNDRSIDEWINQIEYCKVLSNKIKPKIFDFMNNIHKKKFSYSYWDILLGSWINQFLIITIDRWSQLNSINNKDFTHVESPNYNYSELADNTNEIFRRRIETDYWNSIFYGKILDFKQNFKVEYRDFKEKITVDENFFKFNFFKNRQKNTFINTYLSRFDEILINLKLRQIPRFKNKFLVPPTFNYNGKMRFNKKFFIPENQLENFILENLFLYIPRSYLEGFEELDKVIKKENLPENPNNIYCGIFTNRSHILKYIAEKKENGTKVICGDHGGGNQALSIIKDHIKKYSDTYLTWGKTDLKQNEKCVGYIKKKFKNKRPNNIVIFLYNHPKYILKPSVHEILLSKNYIQNISSLVDGFDSDIQKKILFRLIGKDHWEQERLYKREFPKTYFDNAKIKISDIFNKAELIISTYTSTTIIEGIFNNIPSCLFVDSSEINKSIVYEKRKYYQLLHDVGILQTDSNKCAKFLNDLLKTKTLGSWWKSKKTQDALNLFRENICPENKNLVQDITNLMK